MTGQPGPEEIRTSFVRMLTSRPTTFIIGVAGDSGTGKTTFTASLRHLIGDTLVSTLSLDDYHLLDREQRRERNITPLAPEANDLQKLEADLHLLKSGRPIRKRVYNHEKGILEGPFEFSPTPILIVEGLHSIFNQGLRDVTNFSLYVDPDPDVKREWKLKRDTGKRGYSEREALEEMHRREKDYFRYIAPQKDFADAVIRISFSRQGRDLGWREDIYQTTLLSVPTEESDDDTGFFITIPPLFSLKTGTFSIEYGMQEMGARAMAAVTFDGKFNRGFVSGFAGSLMADTGVDPLAIFGQDSLTPPQIVELLLCWRVLQDILRKRDQSW